MTRTPGATESITALQMPTASSLRSKSVMNPMTFVGAGAVRCAPADVVANTAIARVAPIKILLISRTRMPSLTAVRLEVE